ncbi:MAG: T9SS type A sorting domain-containing protein [Bacteroidota bacterium]
MKNSTVLLSSALLAGTILSFSSLYLDNTSQYTPRTTTETSITELERGAAGAAKWLFNIQKDPITGTIDPMDVIKVREEAYQMRADRASASLGLEWSELGPDNVGGRTRAILIDRTNPSKMFAGSVSGGLWVSHNGGGNWSSVPLFDQQPNLAIICLAQAANGDIYAGTGEGDFYFYTGGGSAGILGAGIYKSTDGGLTFARLASTIPTSLNNTAPAASTAFTSVHELGVDPVNPNRIYAATKYGLQSSEDGGTTWQHPIRQGNGNANTTTALDVDVASDGTVIVNVNNKLYKSGTGDYGTFTSTAVGLPASGVSRIEFAVSPDDPNYMYALAGKSSNGLLMGVYQSIDKGASWTNIGNGGSSQFELFGTGQSDYDNTIEVFPGEKTNILIGGVAIWQWSQTNPAVPGVGQWYQFASQNEFNGPMPNPNYVHSDVHDFKFHPTQAILYIGCDGGVFRASQSTGFQPLNNGYNVTQYYSVAFAGDDPAKRAFIGGSQDNGTHYISGHGNTTKSAMDIGGGDGAECEISFLSPNVSFSTVYYGTLKRHSAKGGGGSDFYPAKFATLFPTLGDAGFASFVTPIALYETKTATNSPDFYKFINQPVGQTIGTGDGINKHFTGVLNKPYSVASYLPDSIQFKAGLQEVTDNGSGILVGSVDGTHTNSINYITGAYDFYFTTAPANGAIVNASFDVIYAAGSNLSITRPEYAYPIDFTLTTQLGPGDTALIPDPFQAKIAVGFNGASGVWMTKGALDFSGTPPWIKLGTLAGEAEELVWSADGDILYVGTSSGILYRFSNIAAVKDSTNGDVSSPNTVVVKTQIGGFGGFITGISVDPVDAEKVAVSIGGYGSGVPVHVFYSTTAATCASSTSTTNFTGKQGTGTSKLPVMPVYTVIIEKNDPKRVILGTESGIFSTADITVSNPVWSADNGQSSLFPNVPVFKIRQQRRPGTEVYNPYVIYAATHGRGMWKSENYLGPLSIDEQENGSISKSTVNSGISVYPNPMNENGTIAFALNASADVTISIYNLQGKLVKTIKTGKLNSGEQKIQISTDEFTKGTYFVSVDGSSIHATSKFVVVK